MLATNQADERRHYDESDPYECDQKQNQARDRYGHHRGRYCRAGSQRSQHCELDDRGKILGEKNAECEFAQALGDWGFVIGLGDDRGARDGKQRAGKNGFERGPSERAAAYVAEPDHEADLQRGDESGGRAEAEQLAHAELQPEREHQEDHAEFGQGVDALGIGEQRNDRHMGTYDDSGEEVSDYYWLADLLKDYGGDRGDA